MKQKKKVLIRCDIRAKIGTKRDFVAQLHSTRRIVYVKLLSKLNAFFHRKCLTKETGMWVINSLPAKDWAFMNIYAPLTCLIMLNTLNMAKANNSPRGEMYLRDARTWNTYYLLFFKSKSFFVSPNLNRKLPSLRSNSFWVFYATWADKSPDYSQWILFGTHYLDLITFLVLCLWDFWFEIYFELHCI